MDDRTTLRAMSPIVRVQRSKARVEIAPRRPRALSRPAVLRQTKLLRRSTWLLRCSHAMVERVAHVPPAMANHTPSVWPCYGRERRFGAAVVRSTAHLLRSHAMVEPALTWPNLTTTAKPHRAIEPRPLLHSHTMVFRTTADCAFPTQPCHGQSYHSESQATADHARSTQQGHGRDTDLCAAL